MDITGFRHKFARTPFTESCKKTAAIEEQIRQLGSKYVVKPLREGSTIGISIADYPKEAVEAAKKCTAQFGECNARPEETLAVRRLLE